MAQLEIGERHLVAVAAAGEPLLPRITADEHVVPAERGLEHRRPSQRAGEAQHGARATPLRVADEAREVLGLRLDAGCRGKVSLQRELRAISGHALEEWTQERTVLVRIWQGQRRMPGVP